MSNKKIQNQFLLILLAGAILLSFFIFRPFLNVIILAGAIAVVFQPVYQKILAFVNKKNGLAAALSTIAVFLLLFTPLVLLGAQITKEATALYGYITENGGDMLVAQLSNLINKFSPKISFDINQYARQGLNWLLPNLYSLFSNSASIALDAFVFFFALYYFFKDGHKLKNIIIAMSPLLDIDDAMILKKLGAAVNAIIRGSLTIAIIQGIVSTIGFLIFGVPNATLWGSVTVIAALIPGIGTALVIIPAIIFLLLTGKLLFAAGLLIWGIVAVGTIDNILGPRLMGKGTNLHPLLVFLSVLGGIAFFGPMGILLGPIIISLLIALFDLYALRIGSQK